MGRVASLLALLVLLAEDGALAERTATDTAAWNAIAVQHGRRARATGDATHYAHALLALERARSAEPDNVEAVMIAAWVQLGRHEFATAARLARS